MPAGAELNRSGGAATPAFAQETYQLGRLFGLLLAALIADKAEAGWQSGRCVKLEPTTDPAKRTGLKPSTKVTITAAPRSQVDGGPVGGTVTATLTGATALNPAGTPVQADATFTYTALSEKNADASVALEARSKRGVAKATVVFSTKQLAYVASGGGSRITITGEVADVAAPFDLSGTFPGDKVTLSFTPKDEHGGTYTYSGGGSGVTVKGQGTYTIAGTVGEVLTLTYHGNGCASPGGCAATTAVVTLTPKG
jgi:hypothetical protein